MSETRTLLFPRELPPQRLDTFLAASFPEISRAQLKKLIDDRHVLCDGAAVKAGHRLKGGEALVLQLPEPQPTDAIPQDIPLKIVYEDEDLLVIDKSAGMVVHPAAGHASNTLVNALLHHCDDLAGIGGTLRPGIVHRIDKDTSGLLVITKNDATHQHLAHQFSVHSIRRVYLALVHGHLPTATGTINAPLGRHPIQRKKISSKTRHGKTAVTHWQMLTHFAEENVSLVRLRLETGRTHQIRAHMSEAGHPLVGDPLYGRRSEKSLHRDPHLAHLLKALPGQALHATLLGFIHPRSGAYLEFHSDLPYPFNAIVACLDRRGAVSRTITTGKSVHGETG